MGPDAQAPILVIFGAGTPHLSLLWIKRRLWVGHAEVVLFSSNGLVPAFSSTDATIAPALASPFSVTQRHPMYQRLTWGAPLLSTSCEASPSPALSSTSPCGVPSG
jgi:hypothetical protein